MDYFKTPITCDSKEQEKLLVHAYQAAILSGASSLDLDLDQDCRVRVDREGAILFQTPQLLPMSEHAHYHAPAQRTLLELDLRQLKILSDANPVFKTAVLHNRRNHHWRLLIVERCMRKTGAFLMRVNFSKEHANIHANVSSADYYQSQKRKYLPGYKEVKIRSLELNLPRSGHTLSYA